MQIKFGSEIIKSYKRLSYTLWYALAEFVDNSTESYLSNKQTLDSVLNGQPLTVRIDYDQDNKVIIITDNAMGMSAEDLQDALVVGKEPRNKKGRSRYGLGMKTAASWLGNIWTVRTKKLGETVEHYIVVDVEEVAKDHTELHHQTTEGINALDHYTIIEIIELNHNISGKIKPKIKNYLRSMYREDFAYYNLKLIWDGSVLEWNYSEMIDKKLVVGRDGHLKKKNFKFLVGQPGEEKVVNGWVGVFEKGSRKDAGFSVIQAGRVIKGWPDSYRPESVFGDERNDLVNQRLVGEIFLEDFFVSHTKDEIIFVNDEQEDFLYKLAEACADYKKFASEYRKYIEDERVSTSVGRNQKALNEFEQELTSPLLRDRIMLKSIPSVTLIQQVKSNIVGTVINRFTKSLSAKIDDLLISIYLDPLSPNDPYVLIEVARNKNEVIIIINSAHPHWTYLTSDSDILNFIRHCTYDGVAEWKASQKLDRTDPDTIKFIKDELLRVPFEIEQKEK